MSLSAGENIVVPFAINEVDTLAGTSAELIAPADGFLNELFVIVQKDVTTGGTVKAAVGVTDVAGASVTVANTATKGTVLTATSTKNDTRKVTKGQRIQIIPNASFATAGAVSGHVVINTAL